MVSVANLVKKKVMEVWPFPGFFPRLPQLRWLWSEGRRVLPPAQLRRVSQMLTDQCRLGLLRETLPPWLSGVRCADGVVCLEKSSQFKVEAAWLLALLRRRHPLWQLVIEKGVHLRCRVQGSSSAISRQTASGAAQRSAGASLHASSLWRRRQERNKR